MSKKELLIWWGVIFSLVVLNCFLATIYLVWNYLKIYGWFGVEQ